MKYFLLPLLLFLCSCATVPPKPLSSYSATELAHSYHGPISYNLWTAAAVYADANQKAEIGTQLKKYITSKKDWESIDKSQVSIGMSYLAVLASWGRPITENRTVFSTFTHRQLVYRSTYIYLENDIVTSWSDHN